MPPKSLAQQRYMGMELGMKLAGQKTDVKMSEKQLEDFARKPKGKKLPKRVKKKK